MAKNEKAIVQVIAKENDTTAVMKEVHKASDIEENDIISVKLNEENSEEIDEIIMLGKVLAHEVEEKDLVNIINAETGLSYDLLAIDYLSKINDYNYLDFEKIVKCRELLNSRSKKDKVIKDELSNIIHMNSAYTICLNPYKFNYFSKYVKEYIDNN